MKKSLLALAALGAFAGAASAQSNVTVYGVADVGIQRTDPSNAAATWSMDSGIQSGSRLGFKGTEDLGGGLSAIFTLENGFDISTGAMGQGGTLFGRQAFVGLSGGFGTVKLGRQYTPMFLALDSVDPFGTGLAGDMASGRTFQAAGVRMNNTINYSMSAGGFSGQLAYGLGEVAGNNAASRQIGLSVGYNNGPIGAVLAYHDANDATNAGDSKATLLGGTYNFGVATVHAAFQTEKSTSAATLADARHYMLGASAPVGAGNVLVSWIRNDDRRVTNADGDQIALGYTHSLSKRTNLYTSYGRYNDKSAANADLNLFNVGIRHKF